MSSKHLQGNFYIILLSTIAIFGIGTFKSPAVAVEAFQKRLVIIDTGIDPTIPNFSKHVIYEVCVMFWYSCPNGSGFQQGPGSASLSSALLTYPGFNHGTQMARVAINTNPSVEIVFVRIIGNSASGARLPTSETTVSDALNWVIKNAEQFRIGAVAMSQGHHKFTNSSKYCPATPQVETAILALKDMDIPVFLPSGNTADKSRIDWPACIPSAIAIGAVDSQNTITNYSNMDRKLVDFYALGLVSDSGIDGMVRTYSGTSVSAQVAAAGWINWSNKFPELNYQQLYELVRKRSPIVFDREFRYGRKFNPLPTNM